eukprot:CAMPEP_0117687442 /NCGR_PEP_ID=MMETSP0804-20121206/23140_1 /TAXON_ID=1074897 /ORGANISM="Tetraselmis astigmatica, Strain CCMP880" /LENGTH=30 /DNA_ID= /DNA_START= /DNA_END= /DNA_ORIENTATION=
MRNAAFTTTVAPSGLGDPSGLALQLWLCSG